MRARRWYALHRGVYAVGHGALTPRPACIAAVYACGPGALLSHRAAGALQGLLGAPRRIEVTAPRGCKPKPGIVIHRSRHAPPGSHLVDGIPITSVARTLVDLADVLNEERLARARAPGGDPARLRPARARGALRGYRAAGRHRSTGPGRLPARAALPAQRGRARLKRLCEDHGLPQPQFNVCVAGYEVDAYWPEAKLALEVDGAETHHTRHAFHADRRRDRALAAQGIQVSAGHLARPRSRRSTEQVGRSSRRR